MPKIADHIFKGNPDSSPLRAFAAERVARAFCRVRSSIDDFDGWSDYTMAKEEFRFEFTQKLQFESRIYFKWGTWCFDRNFSCSGCQLFRLPSPPRADWI